MNAASRGRETAMSRPNANGELRHREQKLLGLRALHQSPKLGQGTPRVALRADRASLILAKTFR